MQALIAQFNRLYAALEKPFEMKDFVLLFLRAWVAKIFYQSGRTKVDADESFFAPTDLTVMLFEDEYGLPILSPELAAQLAVYAETFLPIMLLLGLGARIGAAGLIAMTLVIQFLVYPGFFPDHATWLAGLLPVLMIGPGRISVDHLIAKRTAM